MTAADTHQDRDWSLESLNKAYQQALSLQQAKVDDPQLTPSARVLAELQSTGESFRHFALRQSQAHTSQLRNTPLDAEQQRLFSDMARQSLAEQAELEQQEQGDFDSFVAAYQASITHIAN